MPTVRFTPHLRRRLGCEAREVHAETLMEALRAAMDGQDRLSDYVLDERGRLRKHIAVFLDGRLIRERDGGGEVVTPNAQIHVMQALSGG